MHIVKLTTYQEEKNIMPFPIEIPIVFREHVKEIAGKTRYDGGEVSNENLHRITKAVQTTLKETKDDEDLNDFFDKIAPKIDKILAPNDWLVKYEVSFYESGVSHD